MTKSLGEFINTKRLLLVSMIIVALLVSLTYNWFLSTMNKDTGKTNREEDVESSDLIPVVYASALDAYTSFSLELLEKIGFGEKNTVVSPLSIYIALLMLSEGAHGSTREELLNALHLKDLKEARIWFKNLLYRLRNKTSDKAILEIGNSVWVKKYFNVNKSYVRLLIENYLAEYYNFTSIHRVVDRVNKWVNNKTHGLIDKIIDYGDIDELTMILLINTLYFKANWTKPFEYIETEEFHTINGTVKTDFLVGEMYIHYLEENNYVAVALSYRGTSIKFVAIMPKNGDLKGFIEEIGYAGLLDILHKLFESKRRSVELHIPMFDIDSGKIDLKNILYEMGIREVFDKTKSDLRYMIASKEYMPGLLYVKNVFHRARMKITLSGTEAGAATFIGVKALGYVETVKFDKPFLFLLVEPSEYAILFAGNYITP